MTSVRALLASMTMGVAFVLAAACQGSGGTGGTSPPTAVLSAIPSPHAAPGPSLVYTKRVGLTDASGRRWPTLEVVTYDVGAKRELASFEVGKVGEYPVDVILAGDKVIVNLEQRIVLYNTDGSSRRELRTAPPGGHVIGIGASPDGSKLALAEQVARKCEPRCPPYADITSVAFLDVASGQELRAVPQSAPGFAGFRGQAAVFTWRDDGTGAVVQGYTYSEAPSGTATVLLNGTVLTHEIGDYPLVSPNGRYAAVRGPTTICSLSSPIEQHEVSVRELESGGLLSSVHDDTLNLQWQEWSPDGTQLLYQTYSLRPDPGGSPCKLQDENTVRWYVLRVDGSPPSPVDDLEVLRDRWYGDRRVKFLCDDRFVLYPYCPDERGIGQAVDLYVGDTKVDSGMDIRIIGFIEEAGM